MCTLSFSVFIFLNMFYCSCCVAWYAIYNEWTMLLQSSHWLIHTNFNPKNSSTLLNQFVVNWHFNLSPRRQPQQKLTPRTARVTISLCNMKFCIPLPINMKYWNFSAGAPLVRWDKYFFTSFYKWKSVQFYHAMHRNMDISTSVFSNWEVANDFFYD